VGVSQVSRALESAEDAAEESSSSARVGPAGVGKHGFLVRIFGLQVRRPTKHICPFSRMVDNVSKKRTVDIIRSLLKLQDCL
jgi:hypothetical protein